MEDPITRTCNLFSIGTSALALLASPAIAKTAPPKIDPIEAFVQARAAEIAGDNGRAVQLMTALADANPSDKTMVRRALATSIQIGDAAIALRLAKTLPLEQQAFDSRLLIIADALRNGRDAEALAVITKGNTTTETELFAPVIKAWVATEQGKRDGVTAMANTPAESPVKAIANEHRALMLLKLGKVDEALTVARLAMSGSQGSDSRLQLALADGFMKKGRKDVALEMIKSDSDTALKARRRINDGKPLGMAIDTPAKGFAAVLVALGSDFLRDQNRALPIALTQVARYADPGNMSAQILLALLVEGDGRHDEAVRLLQAVPDDHLLKDSAIETELAILTNNERYDEALKLAEPAATRDGANSDAIKLYGDVLADMDRHAQAADAYGRAISVATANGETNDLWTYHLLRAASLEEIDRWPEARADLAAALKIEPENPVLLNFMGYGKLERGEDLPAAEAMIRKASALRPDDAAITDSLGWALFKTGKTDEAITTLKRAAAADAAEAEIHEHLGDALYTAGRRIEARFAWNAAMVTAKDKEKARIQAKLDYGLNSANAAP